MPLPITESIVEGITALFIEFQTVGDAGTARFHLDVLGCIKGIFLYNLAHCSHEYNIRKNESVTLEIVALS